MFKKILDLLRAYLHNGIDLNSMQICDNGYHLVGVWLHSFFYKKPFIRNQYSHFSIINNCTHIFALLRNFEYWNAVAKKLYIHSQKFYPYFLYFFDKIKLWNLSISQSIFHVYQHSVFKKCLINVIKISNLVFSMSVWF